MQTRTTSNDDHHEEWGDGSVVYHRGEGSWIMYDPEDSTVDLDDWR